MIDPRGTRFSAAITTLVLALVIVTTPSPAATFLLSLQTLVFAFGAILGPRCSRTAGCSRRSCVPSQGSLAHRGRPCAAVRASDRLGFALAASISMLFAWTLGVGSSPDLHCSRLH